MNRDDLQQELNKLKDEARRLAKDELDDTGDQASRYQAARTLNERLSALRSRVDAAPRKQKDQLDLLWREAERDLIFLLFAAGQAEKEASKSPEAPTILDLARQLSSEVFALAKAVSDGQVDQEAAQQQVLDFDKRFKELAKLPGIDQPEVQQALSEADLDLNYIYAGGKGAMSLRLHHYHQEENQ